MIKVFLVGSMRHLEPVALADFQTAARVMGQGLAEAGKFEFIICSIHPSTVDRFVLEGAGSINRSSKVRVLIPDEDYSTESRGALRDFIDDSGNAQLQFTVQTVTGGWRVTHLKALSEADLVVAVGGSQRGTGTVVYSAEALEKPVIILRMFPGAAGESWRDLAHYYSDEDRAILSATPPFDVRWTSRFVALCERFPKTNPMRRTRIRPIIFLLIFTLLLAGGWVALLWAKHLAPLPFVLLLTCVSTALGIALHRSTMIQAMQLPDLLSDIVQAIAIGFGLVLLAQGATYIVGADLATSLKTIDRTDLSLRLGGAGFVAGFARPVYLEALTKRAASMLKGISKD